MKKILVLGAGGSPSTNFIKSLLDSSEKMKIIGADSNKYLLMRSVTKINYLVPGCTDPNYIKVLNKIIKKEKIDFVHAQNDEEVFFLSENRESIHANVFLPKKETVRICQNKLLSYNIWANANLVVPKTISVKNKKDLKKAFLEFNGEIWLRAVTGAAGKWSLPTKDFDQAVSWIDFHKGWGSFTAAEKLEPSSITWMSLWQNGKLIVAQTRKRLYWELARLSPSGITGITGAGMTVSDPLVNKISQQAILAIDSSPHGLFGVDLTYDKRNIPNPTEINIGRFFTTIHFFTSAKLNMPYLYVKLAYNERLPKIKTRINPLKNGLVWIRGVDFLPKLTTQNRIEKNVKMQKKLMK